MYDVREKDVVAYGVTNHKSHVIRHKSHVKYVTKKGNPNGFPFFHFKELQENYCLNVTGTW